jgi:hypothetical protein
MAVDQEWCLECGTARTLLQRPPDWKVPALVIGTVVALVLAAFAIALVTLSSDAGPTGQAQAVRTVTITSPVRASARGIRPAAAVGTWPSGLAGWTVALAQKRRRARAYATAQRLHQAGLSVGVLSSSRHPSMTPGYWIVFSGRYPNATSAAAAAAALRAQGNPAAAARLVAPPGGI